MHNRLRGMKGAAAASEQGCTLLLAHNVSTVRLKTKSDSEDSIAAAAA